MTSLLNSLTTGGLLLALASPCTFFSCSSKIHSVRVLSLSTTDYFARRRRQALRLRPLHLGCRAHGAASLQMSVVEHVH